MVGNATCNGDPAFVCQRSDDKPTSSPQILIPILHGGANLADNGMLSILDVVLQLLLLPVEVINRLSLVGDQICNNISVVDIGSDQSHSNFVIDRIFEPSLNQLSQSLQLLHKHLVPGVKGI